MFKQVTTKQGVDAEKIRETGVFREFVSEFMRKDVCNRPERNVRLFNTDFGLESGFSNDGINIDSKNSDKGSVFESASSTTNEQKGFLGRVFDFFGSEGGGTSARGNGENISPVITQSDTHADEANLMERCMNIFGFLLPEGEGSSYFTDSSKMMPSSPFMADMGNFGYPDL